MDPTHLKGSVIQNIDLALILKRKTKRLISYNQAKAIQGTRPQEGYNLNDGWEREHEVILKKKKKEKKT